MENLEDTRSLSLLMRYAGEMKKEERNPEARQM
jgi:hypothetical protein